mgnify:CR=1 FL=1
MQDSHEEDHKLDENDAFGITRTAVKNEGYQKLGVEFPFDLNNLFSMQYSFDTLKQAIEFLA